MRADSLASFAFCGTGTSASSPIHRSKQRRGDCLGCAVKATVQSLESRVLMSASLLKDINVTFADANPNSLTVSNGNLYFIANDGVHGNQLWKSNGTAAGTTMVPIANSNGSLPLNLTDVNGTLYFFDRLSNSGEGGDLTTNLMRSDGTAAGTSVVTEVFDPSTLTDVNGTAYFFAYTQDSYSAPQDLFKTDGTAAGTVPVATTGVSNSATSLNGQLYFMEGDGLWTSNGTSAGTYEIATVANYPYPDLQPQVFSADGQLFITDGPSLDSSNGTVGNLTSLQTFNGTQIGRVTGFNGAAYFFADGSNGVTGLWKSDGTAAGTTLVANMPGQNINALPGDLTSVNGALYFEATNSSTGNTDLWRSDGTSQGTIDINVLLGGASSGADHEMAAMNGSVYFDASDGFHGDELWRSDGTAAGTYQVAQINNTQNNAVNYYNNSVSIGGETYFNATDGTNDGLWKTDGTSAGTVLVSNAPVNPVDLTNVNGTLYFAASGAVWKSDGTAAGTVMVDQILSGANAYPNTLTAVSNEVYFYAFSYATQDIVSLYRTDGTAAGTQAVMQVTANGAGMSSVLSMANVNGTLFFTSVLSYMGLWKISSPNGSAISASPFAWIPPLSTDLTAVNGQLYFIADAGYTSGPEIWETSPTTTTLVEVTSPGSQYDEAGADLYAFNNQLYFSEPAIGAGLFVVNPSNLQASPVSTVTASNLIAVGGQLYFEGPNNGTETLYVTDGQANRNDARVVGAALTFPPANGPQLMADNGLLYFIATDGTHGEQLWQTNGVNTTLADPSETGSGWTPNFLMGAAQNGLIFAATESPIGAEPWVLPSNGTPPAASFVQADTQTSGNWPGLYGTEGYSIIGGDTSLPSYASIEYSNAQFWEWAAQGQADSRAPEANPSSSQHVAAAEFSTTSFTLDLNLAGGTSHEVALYLLDNDKQNRVETVQVANGDTGQVLDTRTISNFENGEYLLYNLYGHVKITFINAPGSLDSVLSAILFGVVPPGSNTTAVYAGVDQTTQGHWTGAYGSQGYDVIDGSSNLPSTVDYSANGEQFYQWATSTTDPRDLQTSPGSSNLVAACAYSNNASFTITLDFLDRQAHQVSFYLLDYDMKNRAETMQISNAVTGAVLNTESFSNFTAGEYARWDLSGDVNITFTNAGGLNEVVSGFFIDPVPSATFVKTDSTTLGSYTGIYGKDGYDVINSAESLPSYAELSVPSSVSNYTWSPNTSDVRALQDNPGSSSRIAATDYSNSSSFTFNLDLTDNQIHQVAFYFLDWDFQHRVEAVEISNARTGGELDDQTVSAFTSGKYLVWDLSGDVNITISNSGGLNEVMSGIFFG